MTNEQDMGLGLAPVADGKDPASGEPDPEAWLGHRDLCSIQWSPICDCDPNNPIDLGEQEATDGQ